MFKDEATRDLLHSQLKLNDDLTVRPEPVGDVVWYHLEAQRSGRFFRLGRAEYTFISFLDGTTTAAAAVGYTASELGPDAFTTEQAVSILHWLVENDLARSAEHGVTVSDTSVSSVRDARKAVERLNPLCLRLPLGNPDRFVEKLTVACGWIHAWPTILASGALLITALVGIAGRWSEFRGAARLVLSADNWLWLTLTWIVLKIVHEASHAVACKRLGGKVPETGLIFILFAPVAYVDVTSSLKFATRWQRMQVAFAGMYAELVLAATALLLWTRIDSPAMQHFLYNVIVMASISTLLFNANPLMKFDGYFLLSDWLAIPNLAGRSNDLWRAFLRHVWLGQRTTLGSKESGWRQGVLVTYGFAALAWRISVMAGLLIAASTMWQGLGLVLAVLGCVALGSRSLGALLFSARRLLIQAPSQFVRAALVSSVVGAMLVATLWLTPWPFASTAPGFVEHQDLAVVRAGSSGFVRSTHVVDGQAVVAGQLLIELENLELITEVNDLLAQIDQADLRYLKHVKDLKHAEAQIEAAHRDSLDKRLTEKRRQLESLTIRAPVAGRVMSRSLITLKGTYAHEGDELLAVGDEGRKEFRLSVAQSDAARLAISKPVVFRLPSAGLLCGDVSQIAPHATQVPPHLALTAATGGSLPVRPVSDQAADGERATSYEFLEPRVTVRIALDANTSNAIFAGAVGSALLPGDVYENLGEGLYFNTQRWVREQLIEATMKSTAHR